VSESPTANGSERRPKAFPFEGKVAEAERSSAKTDEVETCTNPVRDLNQIGKEK